MRFKFSAIIGLAFAGLILTPQSLIAADAEAGKAIFTKKCKTCHGAEGQGNAGMAKVLKVTIKHLGDPTVQDNSDEEIKKAILEGFGKMKPVKGVAGADAENVIAFVRTIKQ